MNARLTFLLIGLVGVLAVPVSAQFNFGKINETLQKAKDTANKARQTADSVTKVAKGVAGIGIEEETSIGDSVAVEVIARFGGVVRDEEITRRVNLVGKGLAHYSKRPALEWRFGVLDSDSVNAFSAPGGHVFITRGLYDLAGDNDDALAAVLAHEIAHITERHALKIIERAELLSGAGDFAQRSSDFRRTEAELRQFDLSIDEILKALFEKGYDPQTEYAADRLGRQLAVTTGYAPGALRQVLTQLRQRKGDEAKAIFSTHPPLAERIKRLPADK